MCNLCSQRKPREELRGLFKVATTVRLCERADEAGPVIDQGMPLCDSQARLVRYLRTFDSTEALYPGRALPCPAIV